MLDNIIRFEQKALKEIPMLEKDVIALIDEGKVDDAQKMLNKYTADFEAATYQTWKEMEHKFWEMNWVNF